MADKQISDLTSASALTDGSLFVLEQAGAAMKANWGMMKNYISPGVAAQYSSSATYDVGDYVIYNGNLYRCTTAITTAETWTAAHWTAAVLGNDVGELKNNLNAHIVNAFGHGLNYYNYETISKGYALKIDGTIENQSVGYISDYIAVKPSTVYNKRYVFNSSAIADVGFYTSDKNFISAFYHSGSITYFTTPANCYYIKICGYLSNAISEQIEEGNAFTNHEFYQNILSPSAGGADVAFLYGDSQIVLDTVNKKILLSGRTTGGSIILHIPGLAVKGFNNPVSYTGSGDWLRYNSETETFSLSNKPVIDEKHIYNIGVLGGKTVHTSISGTFDNAFIVSDNPILLYDYVNSKLKVNIDSGTYLWQWKGYIQLPEESYDLVISPENINCIWFNLATKKFTVTNNFVDYPYETEYVSIGFIYKSNVFSSIPFTVKNGSGHTNEKKVITYGDSLTWYDGNEFTWGEHQGEICYGYQTYLKYVLGMDVTNRGASGYTTPQIVANRILTDASAIRNMDYAIIMPSIMNDDRLDVSPGTPHPIGGTFDDTTTAGALQKAIEYIYSVKPDIRIVIIVEPMGFTYRDNAPHMTNELLPIAIRNVAKLYGIPCIDLWAKSGINALTRNTYFADPTFESGNQLYMYHPNNFGWEVISRIICNEMEAY